MQKLKNSKDLETEMRLIMPASAEKDFTKIDRILNKMNSETFKNFKSYRDDFTHNLTQELANSYELHTKFWHTHDLIRLLI